MKVLITRVSGFAIVAYAMSTLASIAAQGSNADMNIKSIELTERRDNGKTVNLPVDGSLTVTLDTVTGTGYSWHLVKNDSGLMTVVERNLSEKGEKRLLGRTQCFSIKLRAIHPGTDVIELQYKRGWEHEIPPLKVFSITVHIR